MADDLEYILDDENNKDEKLSALKDEFRDFSFWLKFSGILLFIVGILGVLGTVFLLLEVGVNFWYRNSEAFFLLLGMLIAFFVSITLSYTHFLCAKSVSEYRFDESELRLERIAKQSSKDWRLLAIAFLFSAIGVGQFFIIQAYRDYSNSYYVEEPVEKPAMVEESDQWEEPAPQESFEEELMDAVDDEDPTPLSN